MVELQRDSHEKPSLVALVQKLHLCINQLEQVGSLILLPHTYTHTRWVTRVIENLENFKTKPGKSPELVTENYPYELNYFVN